MNCFRAIGKAGIAGAVVIEVGCAGGTCGAALGGWRDESGAAGVELHGREGHAVDDDRSRVQDVEGVQQIDTLRGAARTERRGGNGGAS